jgi:hypothetical protein
MINLVMSDHASVNDAFNRYLLRRGEYPDTFIRAPDSSVFNYMTKTGATNVYLMGALAGRIDELALERMLSAATYSENMAYLGTLLHSSAKGFLGRTSKKIGNFLYVRHIGKLHEMMVNTNKRTFPEQMEHEAIEGFARLAKLWKVPIKYSSVRSGLRRLFEERLPLYLFDDSCKQSDSD